MTTPTVLTNKPKKPRVNIILRDANDDAVELCHAIVDYFVTRLSRLPPSTACDAEDIAGKAQTYLKKYGS